MWYYFAPFIAPCTCLGSRTPCLWRSFGFWRLFHSQDVHFTHPYYTGQSVCKERGRRGCRAIHHTGHKVHFMGIKDAAVCVHVCVRTCVVMGVWQDLCKLVYEHVTDRASECVCLLSFPACSVCYFVCAVVCVGRYRRMQDGKRARIFKQWMVNNLWVHRVWSSWKNLWRELSEAAQRLSLSSLQEKANPDKLSVTKLNKWFSLLELSSESVIFHIFIFPQFLLSGHEDANSMQFGLWPTMMWASTYREKWASPWEDCHSPLAAGAEKVSCCWRVVSPRGSHCSCGSSRRRGWKCSGSGASLGCCWTGRLEEKTTKNGVRLGCFAYRKWATEEVFRYFTEVQYNATLYKY